MASPIVQAVEGVCAALRELVDAGEVAIPALRVIETYRPTMLRESFEDGISAIVYPQATSRSRSGMPAQFDEYQIDVAVELVRRIEQGSLLEQQKLMINYGQDIADGLSRKLSVSLGMMASSDAGMFEDLSHDELDLISVKVSGIYRIMHSVT